MSAYQRTTGLKAVGVHRAAADMLLEDVSHRCRQCSGAGYFEVRNAWLWCESCGGLGRVMTPKAQLLLRGLIEGKFPGSGSGPGPELVLA
jgi:hypothetical protein